MKAIVKNLEYNEELLETLGVIPFTLKKDSLIGENIISWTSSPKSFSEEMKNTPNAIVNYVFDHVKKAGLDEMVMPDQPENGKLCHEITFKDVEKQYKEDIAKRQGTLWNVEKKYDSVFMTLRTHYRVMETYGRSIALVYPAADCAIVRLYDKKRGVIGLTHSDLNRTSKNIVGHMVEFMKKKYHSDPNDIMVFVGAFAHDGMIWDKYPPCAEKAPEVWKNYIEKIDDNHYDIHYGDCLYDQLIASGLSKDNIYFDPDNTVKDHSYFSNNRIKLLNEPFGRNMFGITFDSLPVYENVENDEIRTRLK